MRHRHHKTSLAKKLAWLKENKHLWKDMPQVLTKEHRATIVEALKKAGLISFSTYMLDVRVQSYLDILREQK